MTASEPLLIGASGAAQMWTINLPQVGNAITGSDFIRAFEDAVDAANRDPTVGAVILTGSGKIFSAGGNVKEMADREGMFGLDAIDQRFAYVDGSSASRGHWRAWRCRSSPRSTVPPSAPVSTWP